MRKFNKALRQVSVLRIVRKLDNVSLAVSVSCRPVAVVCSAVAKTRASANQGKPVNKLVEELASALMVALPHNATTTVHAKSPTVKTAPTAPTVHVHSDQ